MDEKYEQYFNDYFYNQDIEEKNIKYCCEEVKLCNIDGYETCISCGKVYQYCGEYEGEVNYTEYNIEVVHMYNEYKNFKKNIDKIFCIDRIDLKTKEQDLIKNCTSKYEIMAVLKKHKLNHLYIHINWIAHVKLGDALPKIDNDLIYGLIKCHRDFHYKFNLFKVNTDGHKDRKNQLKTVFIIEKFLQSLSREDLIEYLPNRIKCKSKIKSLNKLYSMIDDN